MPGRIGDIRHAPISESAVRRQRTVGKSVTCVTVQRVDPGESREWLGKAMDLA